MRLRNITGARDIIAKSEYVVQEPAAYKGRWKELFENKGKGILVGTESIFGLQGSLVCSTSPPSQ